MKLSFQFLNSPIKWCSHCSLHSSGSGSFLVTLDSFFKNIKHAFIYFSDLLSTSRDISIFQWFFSNFYFYWLKRQPTKRWPTFFHWSEKEAAGTYPFSFGARWTGVANPRRLERTQRRICSLTGEEGSFEVLFFIERSDWSCVGWRVCSERSGTFAEWRITRWVLPQDASCCFTS